MLYMCLCLKKFKKIKLTTEENEQRVKFQQNFRETTDLRIDTVKRIFEEEIQNYRDESRVKSFIYICCHVFPSLFRLTQTIIIYYCLLFIIGRCSKNW